MNIDILIIGQGICGTMLGWYLEKTGLSFLVIDESKPFTASKSAAGIINPVTGRRIVKTWMIDELMPFALHAYQTIQQEFNAQFISQKTIIDFFPSAQMRQAFLTRYESDQQYLRMADDEKKWYGYFNYELGWGEIDPVYLVDVQNLILAYRKKISDRQLLIEEHFSIDQLVLSENKIRYRDIVADKIIFCDGIETAQNSFFKALPFAPNKGEALIIESENIPAPNIFKKALNIVPWKDNLFWVGSSYEWEFQDDRPTEIFRKKTEALLQHWLKSPFKIIDHFASVRPATLERRPFIGFHPQYPPVGIMNGMGTKGCSLAPYFAAQFSRHIVSGAALTGEADIHRFAKVLARANSTPGN
ncbi:MAG: FAD-binding oxidoreductase [Bacteroidetes bacterium]|nr:FAD-binding oxidoreductase [Bacteroidota bacterium]